jgi:hypothetical protein
VEAEKIDITEADVSGFLNSGGLRGTAIIQYGTSLSKLDSATLPLEVAGSSTDQVVTSKISGLIEDTEYFYQMTLSTNLGSVVSNVSKFRTRPQVGISINNGSRYSNSANVELNVNGPIGSTSAVISNDGGFAKSRTETVQVGSNIQWKLDDSIKGLYTKVVYVRFYGPGIDNTKTYSDDIILDTASPITSAVSGVSVVVPTSSVTTRSFLSARKKNGVRLRISARDAISGIGSFEVKTSVRGKVVSVNASSSKAKSHTVRLKTKARKLWVRSVDRAGNKSRWVGTTLK